MKRHNKIKLSIYFYYKIDQLTPVNQIKGST
jgi:hypothetical protein